MESFLLPETALCQSIFFPGRICQTLLLSNLESIRVALQAGNICNSTLIGNCFKVV